MAPPNRSARVAVLGSSLQRSKQSPHPSRGRSGMVRRVVLAVLVVVALALLTVSFRSPTSGVLHDAQSYGSDALRPFQVAAVRVARPFRDGYDYLDSLATAKSRNAKLEKMVRDYRSQDMAFEIVDMNLEERGKYRRLLTDNLSRNPSAAETGPTAVPVETLAAR